MKTALLLTGPSCGSIGFLRRLLMEAGCKGSHDFPQLWERSLPQDEELVVWQKCCPYPYGDGWDVFGRDIAPLRDRGYRVLFVVADQEPTLTAQIKTRKERCSLDEAWSRIKRAHSAIRAVALVHQVPVLHMSVEAADKYPNAVLAGLFSRLGWDSPRVDPRPFLGTIQKRQERYLQPLEEGVAVR